MPKSIRGVITDGIIRPLEKIPYPEGTIVNIVEEKRQETVKRETPKISLWQKLKDSIAEEYPELRKMTKDEATKEFERLSAKIRKNMKFKDWREMERHMKGNYYDLAGY